MVGRVVEILSVISVHYPEIGIAQPHRLFQHRIEHRGEVAGRGVDHLQYLGGRDLLLQCLVTFSFAVGEFGSAFGKLTFEIGDPLLGIGQGAVGRRAHLRTSSRPTFRVDHTVIDPGYHRLSTGTITGAPPNYRCRGDPVGSACRANGRLRRTAACAPPTAKRQQLPRSRPSRQLAGDPESSHPSSAMSICRDWELQPLSHQQVMNLT